MNISCNHQKFTKSFQKTHAKQRPTGTQGPDFDFWIIWLGACKVTATLQITFYPLFDSQYEICWNRKWQSKAPWDVFQMNWVIVIHTHTHTHTLWSPALTFLGRPASLWSSFLFDFNLHWSVCSSDNYLRAGQGASSCLKWQANAVLF